MDSSSSSQIVEFSSSSSDESSGEEINLRNVHALSMVSNMAYYMLQQMRGPKTRNSISRDRVAANDRLIRDYFSENPEYGDIIFHRRYRMNKELFVRIVNDMEQHFPYFRQGWDARGRIGFTSLQKCTSCIRQLAYGVIPDSCDEYLKMSERTSREALQHFCYRIIQLYAKEYLRKLTASDIQLLYATHESKHGFPGMLGSIDCTHWSWRNCPTVWRGQYKRGDHEHPTIMLEVVASQDLWLWHAFFGPPGSNNDINVLNQSPLFNDVLNGAAPDTSFVANEVQYKHGYYLADGIYPEWATFVKAFSYPTDPKRIKFKKAQESARKDVERAFGRLKAKWDIVDKPARTWHPQRIRMVMYTCVILHNMILKDEGNAICPFEKSDLQLSQERVFQEVYINNLQEIRNRDTHNNLRSDLVKHIWKTQLPDLDD